MSESQVTAVECEPDLVVVRVLVENLNEESVRRMQADIFTAADANPGMPFVLDLARVNFVPSLSLAALIRVSTDFKARQQRLILAGMQPVVHDIFVATRLNRLFDLQDDVETATRGLRPA